VCSSDLPKTPKPHLILKYCLYLIINNAITLAAGGLVDFYSFCGN